MSVRLSDIRQQAKQAKYAFLGHFWTHVGQSYSHIGCAKPMPFASINSTNPRTNPWKFHEKILRIGGAGKWGFFEAAILNFLSRPFWIFFFCFISVKNPAHLYEVSFFFLHYGWFFQNLGKEAVRTFMHTTVHTNVCSAHILMIITLNMYSNEVFFQFSTCQWNFQGVFVLLLVGRKAFF